MSALAGVNTLRVEKEEPFAEAGAFAAFVERHAQFAYKVAFARLRHKSDAEDAVQEAFLKLWKSERWKTAEDERAFLARTVWRTAADLFGKRDLRTEASETVETLEPPSPALDPERSAEQARLHERVHRLIDTLPESLRYPLVLSALEEMTSGEIAAVLRIPEGTVR